MLWLPCGSRNETTCKPSIFALSLSPPQGFAAGKILPQGRFTRPEDVKFHKEPKIPPILGGDWQMPSDAVATLWQQE